MKYRYMSRKKGYKHTAETKLKISLTQSKKIKRICLICEREFMVKRSRIKKGGGKYCSRECHNRSMDGQIPWNKGKKFVHSGSFKKGYISKLKGKNHHNWQGGKSFEKYGIDWTKTLKQSIRERDKYVCQECHKLQSNQVFCVHHIDYNKKNCNPDNLITLCRSCHIKLHNAKRQDLRKEFFRILLKLARKDKHIILMVCDLGYSFVERYQKELPNQFINMGISEQNAIGVAAGLALGGYKPFVYSGAVFATMRPYEFIRDEVCYNNLGVKIIGTGAADFLGFSHNLSPENEDELILKHLPNLKLYFPKSKEELEKLLLKVIKIKTPCYINI